MFYGPNNNSFTTYQVKLKELKGETEKKLIFTWLSSLLIDQADKKKINENIDLNNSINKFIQIGHLKNFATQKLFKDLRNSYKI